MKTECCDNNYIRRHLAGISGLLLLRDWFGVIGTICRKQFIHGGTFYLDKMV